MPESSHSPAVLTLVALGVIVSALVVSLVALDVGATEVRKALSRPKAPPGPALRIESPIYHHDLGPRFSGSDTWGGVQVPYFTNDLGFRDATTRAVPRKGKGKRWLLLGDSFTEGMGVPYEQTFAGRLASALSPRNIDVLNASVASYSPIIYYRKARYLLEEAGLDVDQVVVFLDLSDIPDSIFYRLTPDDRVEGRIPWKNHPLSRLVARDSLLWLLGNHTTWIFKAWDGAYCRRHSEACRYTLWPERANWTHDDSLWREFGEDGMRLAAESMNRLSELLQRHHVPLLLVIYPWPSQIFGRETQNRHVTFWSDWARRHGAGFLDLFPDFIGHAEPRVTLESWFIPGDVHWNAEGHAFVAKRLLESGNLGP